ncbi:MAG: hypothetical protein Q8N23_36090 [Archangium sp.]|nr:hypothetical protein [Archangium sp.]MDP3158149.1 hypothetical protein [Archangium sp.]MDP3570444.1 hypothetical protein [Archangium sp.]
MRALISFSFFFVLAACGGPTGPLWEKSESKTQERLNALYGFAPDDVWAAGMNGTVLHFDGSAWTAMSSGTSRNLTSIWGIGPSDIWFVGEAGAVLRWNGTSLSAVSGAASVNFNAVRGSAANSVFFCSSSGLFVFDTRFLEFTRGGDPVECESLFSLGGATVGALVDTVDGSSANEVMTLSTAGGEVYPAAGKVNGYQMTVVGVTPTELWVLSENAESVTRVGSGAPRELVLPQGTSAVTAWVNAPDDVWLAGTQGMISRWNGTELTLSAVGESSAPVIRALWGTPASMWAAGDDGWLLRRVEVTP